MPLPLLRQVYLRCHRRFLLSIHYSSFHPPAIRSLHSPISPISTHRSSSFSIFPFVIFNNSSCLFRSARQYPVPAADSTHLSLLQFAAASTLLNGLLQPVGAWPRAAFGQYRASGLGRLQAGLPRLHNGIAAAAGLCRQPVRARQIRMFALINIDK